MGTLLPGVLCLDSFKDPLTELSRDAFSSLAVRFLVNFLFPSIYYVLAKGLFFGFLVELFVGLSSDLHIPYLDIKGLIT